MRQMRRGRAAAFCQTIYTGVAVEEWTVADFLVNIIYLIRRNVKEFLGDIHRFFAAWMFSL
jgi:hypothetical protein